MNVLKRIRRLWQSNYGPRPNRAAPRRSHRRSLCLEPLEDRLVLSTGLPYLLKDINPSLSPATGWFRDGCCRSGAGDVGLHLVCARMTHEFLEFSLEAGNDLVTPNEDAEFPGLEPGDQWCICVERWREALEAGVAPPVVLAATHISTLEFVSLEDLQAHAAEE